MGGGRECGGGWRNNVLGGWSSENLKYMEDGRQFFPFSPPPTPQAITWNSPYLVKSPLRLHAAAFSTKYSILIIMIIDCLVNWDQ